MKWIKLGQIFSPDTKHEWSQTHAQVPTVDVLSDNILRVYYCSRDAMNKSRISYFDVDSENPTKVIYKHNKPIMDLGKIGSFDDAGMMPSSIVSVNGLKYLYYTGWCERKSVPYQNTIGLAISIDGGNNFVRAGEGPVFGLTLDDPYFIGTASILYDNGIWRNWYASCTGWELIDGRLEPRYHLKYAESHDGIEWRRDSNIAVDYKDGDEGGLVRAAVIRDSKCYLMWFSRRNIKNYRTDLQSSYRIGFAKSGDGRNWLRCDEFSGIDVSQSGWDSEMIAYPNVVKVNNLSLLFYNGNGFGYSGIGVAKYTNEQF